MNDETDPEARALSLEKENRLLTRKLARLDFNVRQMEEMQDATSKLLSTLTQELAEERAKSEALLLNILPRHIIDRLGAGETVIADRLSEVTVLFSDIVGFTETSSDVEPHQLVSRLNSLFSRFDALCEETEVEKIKTIGDAYMAVGGLSGTRADHTVAIAELAIGMVSSVRDIEPADGPPWRIRIGIHTGPAVAGVIGTRKFVYDVWGDTVNVASRLESTAEPNQIQVSEPVASALQTGFVITPRGVVELKGKGGASTFILNGRRPPTES